MLDAATFLRTHVQAPRFREWLAACLRKRVPGPEAEDLAQSVICEALTAIAPPSPDEIPRWIAGIARHEVADFYRRARREPIADVGDDTAGHSVPLEARDLLSRVVIDASQTERTRETLEWIVREHAGEPLSEIAKQTRIAAPVVRQRVSRMRRALRLRWVGFVALLLASGAVAAAVVARQDVADIRPDPAAELGPRLGSSVDSGTLAAIQGEWVAHSWAAEPSLDASRRLLADMYLQGLRVSVAASTFTLRSGGSTAVRSTSMRQVGSDSFAALAGADSALITVEGDRMTVVSRQGAWRGTVELRRLR
jgi:DNA-directed RNA polymerase specialized sigma24 family protein